MYYISNKKTCVKLKSLSLKKMSSSEFVLVGALHSINSIELGFIYLKLEDFLV